VARGFPPRTLALPWQVRCGIPGSLRPALEVISTGQGGLDRGDDKFRLLVNLFVAEAEGANSGATELSVSPAVTLKVIGGRVESCAINFDDKPISQEEVDATDRGDLYLLSKPDARGAEVELEHRLTSAFAQS
jgi:hypothetical protein